MKQIVIGYDERVASSTPLPPEFLLKPVNLVRSADRYVWPSLRDGMTFAPVERQHAGAVAVAITYLIDDNGKGQDSAYFYSLNDGCSPSTLPGIFSFLGYDVCDRMLLSGLMNCAYSSEEKEVYSQQWANKLNGTHLFINPHDAVSFARETSERVREHAPFFVFGVYHAG